MFKKTKQIVLVTFCVIFIFGLCTVFAHSGDTDAYGGHWNHSTGEYHYHHGYPEHQHKNGVCPYELPKADVGEVLGKIFLIVVFGFGALFFAPFISGMIFLAIDEIKYKITRKEKNKETDDMSADWGHVCLSIVISIILLSIDIIYFVNL